jgi:hypothetical protein
MHGAIPPLPQYALMAWCLVKHRDNFTIVNAMAATAYFKVLSNFYGRLKKKESHSYKRY